MRRAPGEDPPARCSGAQERTRGAEQEERAPGQEGRADRPGRRRRGQRGDRRSRAGRRRRRGGGDRLIRYPEAQSRTSERTPSVYAIVRGGGRQHKVAVGDVLEVDRLAGEPGTTVTLPALLVVDGSAVTSDKAALGGVTVTAEVVEHTKGPKIDIGLYKNKTGYRRRLGHRQRHTQVRVTGIETK